jgi:putative ABC transport system ATP-binding protein
MSATHAPARETVVLRTEHLGRSVGDVAIVSDISLEVRRAELMGVVGASGSGKTSLLRLLNLLDEPTGGRVFLEGEDYRRFSPRELRRRVGMVTQRPFLFPGNVASNLRFGPLQRGERLSDGQVSELLECVGMSGFARRDVTNLSGGEQQRVSLARALANRPEVLLLDEPTSALDEQAKLGIEDLICNLVRKTALTCVLVTHDRDQARRMCDRVAILEAGRLVRTGTPVEVLGA